MLQVLVIILRQKNDFSWQTWSFNCFEQWYQVAFILLTWTQCWTLNWIGSSMSIESVSLFLSAFLQNIYLFLDHWHGDVSPHLAQPCCVALGQALDSGLICRIHMLKNLRSPPMVVNNKDSVELSIDSLKPLNDKHGVIVFYCILLNTYYLCCSSLFYIKYFLHSMNGDFNKW